MKRAIPFALLMLLLISAGCPQDTDTTPSESSLDVAVEGVGGESALIDWESMAIQAIVTRSSIGEDAQPSLEPHGPVTLSLSLNHDVEGDNLRLDYERGGDAPAEYSEIIAGNLGFMVGSDARFGGGEGGNLGSDRVASSRKQQRLLNPHLILREALEDPSIAKDGTAQEIDGVEHNILIIEDDVSPITLFVNSESGLISKLETLENDHWLRDVELEVLYADWQATEAGLVFPNAVSIALDGGLIHGEVRSSIQVNSPLDDALFSFPEGADPSFDAETAEIGEKTSQTIQIFSALGFPQPVGQTAVDPQQIAQGVFHLRGSSHNSLVIEQANGVVVAEAPLYPERSDAVIAWVEEQFPNKPITHVISSHHHRDHSSGLRTYVAREVPVVMNELGAEIFSEIFARPSTILPDALAQNPVEEPAVEQVDADGTFEIPDPQRPVTVAAIAPAHAADTLFTHVGGANIVFMGDGGIDAPELVSKLQELNLSAATLAGGHGDPAPFQ